MPVRRPHRHLLTVALGVAAVVFASLFMAGCGSSGASNASPSASPRVGGGAATTVTIVGINNSFEQTEPTAPAGAVTILFDNRDDGVIHNIHFHKGKKVSSPSVAVTDLESGPIEQTLELDLGPGEYFYQCDVHPATMKGILTAQ